VHGSKVRNLSAELSLSQTSKNTFLLPLCLQQNWRTRKQNRFYLEAVVGGEVAQTMYIHVSKCKNKFKKIKKET
jgi:hypothetical protein